MSSCDYSIVTPLLKHRCKVVTGWNQPASRAMPAGDLCLRIQLQEMGRIEGYGISSNDHFQLQTTCETNDEVVWLNGKEGSLAALAAAGIGTEDGKVAIDLSFCEGQHCPVVTASPMESYSICWRAAHPTMSSRVACHSREDINEQ